MKIGTWYSKQDPQIVWGAALVLGMIITAVVYAKNNDDQPVVQLSSPTPEQRFQSDLKFHGKAMAMGAIMYQAKDPESVKFLSQVVEQIYPNDSSYAGKWLVTGTNSFGGRVKGYGIAAVHFKGGDVNDGNNWEVRTARIDE